MCVCVCVLFGKGAKIWGGLCRQELFAGVQLQQQDNRVSCSRASAVAREVPEVNGTKVEGRKLHASKMQGLELTSPQGEKSCGGALMPPSLSSSSSSIAPDKSVDPGSSGIWIAVAMAAAFIEMDRRKREEEKSTAATRLVPIDTLRRGQLVENDLVYRQAFIIRSYEAGFDRIASIETLSNLFQVNG